MAAADGTEGIFEPDTLGARMGLKSWLFFLDLAIREPVVAADLRGGRVGEASREGRGEFAADEDAERCGMVGVVVEDDFGARGGEDGGLLSLVFGAAGTGRLLTSAASIGLPPSSLGFSTEDAIKAG